MGFSSGYNYISEYVEIGFITEKMMEKKYAMVYGNSLYKCIKSLQLEFIELKLVFDSFRKSERLKKGKGRYIASISEIFWSIESLHAEVLYNSDVVEEYNGINDDSKMITRLPFLLNIAARRLISAIKALKK